MDAWMHAGCINARRWMHADGCMDARRWMHGSGCTQKTKKTVQPPNHASSSPRTCTSLHCMPVGWRPSPSYLAVARLPPHATVALVALVTNCCWICAFCNSFLYCIGLHSYTCVFMYCPTVSKHCTRITYVMHPDASGCHPSADACTQAHYLHHQGAVARAGNVIFF